MTTLSEDFSNATYQIQAVFPHNIVINGHPYTNSLIISPEKLIENWHPTSVDSITNADWELLLSLEPEIILLGTGEHSIILPPQKLPLLTKKQFQLECMNTQAACRTYTLLISEGRKVVAGLIL